MTKNNRILVLRANNLRHRALGAHLRKSGFDVFEVVQDKKSETKQIESDLIREHFNRRRTIEEETFASLVCDDLVERELLKVQDMNHISTISLCQSIDPRQIVVFGTPILMNDWLEFFHKKILGIHLGLSPYYRGSGTNFFPFVNNELGAVGFTLMSLDKGVDTGPIVHQKRAQFQNEDDIHTVGNRLILAMFEDIAKILEKEVDLESALPQPRFDSRYYKKKDFTEETLAVALKNLSLGAVAHYIDKMSEENSKFPLLRNLELI